MEPPDTPVMFEPNKHRVPTILETPIGLAGDGLAYVPIEDLPGGHRSPPYRANVNEGGNPSEQVTEMNRPKSGREYVTSPRATTPSPHSHGPPRRTDAH